MPLSGKPLVPDRSDQQRATFQMVLTLVRIGHIRLGARPNPAEWERLVELAWKASAFLNVTTSRRYEGTRHGR